MCNSDGEQRESNQMNEGQIKTLTAENWTQPDPTMSVFVDQYGYPMSKDEWARKFLAIELSSKVAYYSAS